MIKVTSIKLSPDTKKALVTLFSDTKAEITSGMTVEGLPAEYDIDFGSSVITASGDVAFLKSDDTWSWI